jgi:hypothetical protein
MDQRSTCLFLALKGLSARAVDNKFVVILGADAIAYSTVTKYLSQRQFTSILVDLHKEPVTIVIDSAILDALEQYPLSIIFYSGVGSFHLHSNYYSPSTHNVITWFCGEASSLGSQHPHACSKNGACYSLN